MNKADTCRKFVVPKLQAAGWEKELHSIAEQRCFTDVRIAVHENQTKRKRGKPTDYLIRFSRDFRIPIDEGKADNKKPADDLQQANHCAQILDQKFADASIGTQLGRANPALFDLLGHLAFGSRSPACFHCAGPVKEQETASFNYLNLRACEIVDDLLRKYESGCCLKFSLPEVLKTSPISNYAIANEVVVTFETLSNYCNRFCMRPKQITETDA